MFVFFNSEKVMFLKIVTVYFSFGWEQEVIYRTLFLYFVKSQEGRGGGGLVDDTTKLAVPEIGGWDQISSDANCKADVCIK